MTTSLIERSLATAPVTASPTKIRLAHLQLLPMLSGVQRVSLDLLTSLDPAEFERFLICREPGPLSEAAQKVGIECRFVPQMVRPLSPLRDVAAYRQLKALFMRERFDIVHTNSSKPGIVGRFAARAAKIPVIVHTVHGFAFPAAKSLAARMLYQTAERVCRSRTDALICLNESDRSIAEQQLRFSANQLHIVGNGVDTESLRPAGEAERTAARELLGCPHGRFAVGMVGRLWPQKDPLCFVETADLLVRQGVNADFFLIGDGELRDSLEAEIKKRGMVDRIKILGWRDDVPQLLRALDVFVLTSRWEGMPLVILEALACGVPVVASNIAGNRDTVEHCRTGLLADVGSPKSFAANIARLLTDHTLRHNFQVAGRESAERRFSLTATVGQVRSLYRSLLEKASGRRSANLIDATPGIQTAARATSTSG